MLQVDVVRAHRNGMTVERPRSAQHLESEFQRMSQSGIKAERKPSADRMKSSKSPESTSLSTAFGGKSHSPPAEKTPEMRDRMEKGLQQRTKQVSLTPAKSQRAAVVQSQSANAPTMRIPTPQQKRIK